MSAQNSQKDGLQVSIVLPVVDEAEMIGQLIPEIVETLSQAGIRFEVIAVDDGSQDSTIDVLRELKGKYKDQFHFIQHLYNRGNGAALRSGASVARGEIVVFMDADGQHSPAEIQNLLDRIPPYDLVIGARQKGYRGPRMRKLANAFYNSFASWLSRTNVEDLTSGFRAMRRDVLEHFLPILPSGFSSPTTITLSFLKGGYNVCYVPADVKPRQKGESKISIWRDGSRFIIIILRMTMLYDPLRIFLPVSFGLAGLAIAAWVLGWINAGRLVLPNSAILLFAGSLFTWLLGMVSTQIASSSAYYHSDETIILDDEPVHNIHE
jgi:glycosyltransferase involved in cell wall biosynthesis